MHPCQPDWHPVLTTLNLCLSHPHPSPSDREDLIITYPFPHLPSNKQPPAPLEAANLLTSPLLFNTQTDFAPTRCFAHRQAALTLGGWGRSFMVGFGSNPPTRPHHRSASCPVSRTIHTPHDTHTTPLPAFALPLTPLWPLPTPHFTLPYSPSLLPPHPYISLHTPPYTPPSMPHLMSTLNKLDQRAAPSSMCYM